MIKVANNLQKLISSPLITGTGVGLLGGGIGAGLFHLLANDENKTLVNYLLAAGAGALPAGYVGYSLRHEQNLDNEEIAKGNPSFDPTEAIKQEEEKAKSKAQSKKQ